MAKKKSSYVPFHRHIFNDPLIYQLTAHERLLLDQLYMQYNGKNNGDFSCAWSVMKKKGWNSKTTLFKAKQGLLTKGWIEETRKGYTGVCSLYAVTFLKIDDCNGKLDIKTTNVPSMKYREIN